MENTMSGNDLQNRCGLNDTQELRSPPEVDCQQPESPQGGPRHLGEACRARTGTSARGSGHRPAVACATAALRRPASRLRSGFGSRLRAALLSVLALVLGLPFAGPAAAQEVVEVPRAWTLKPSGLSATQKEFRLLFVTSTGATRFHRGLGTTTLRAEPSQPPGIPSIRPFSSKFRVVGSTTVHARDNTGTTYTSSDKGPPIWWLNGSQSRRQLPGFLRRQLGQREREERVGQCQTPPDCPPGGIGGVWTGSNNNGTKHGGSRLEGPNPSSE